MIEEKSLPTQVLVLGTGNEAHNALRGRLVAQACNYMPEITKVIPCGLRSTLNPNSFREKSEAHFTGEIVKDNLNGAARRRIEERQMRFSYEDTSLTTGENFVNSAEHVRCDEPAWLVAPGAQEKRAKLLGRKAFGNFVPLIILTPRDFGFTEYPEPTKAERLTEFMLRSLSRPFLIGMNPDDERSVEKFKRRMVIPDGIAKLTGKFLGKTLLKSHQALAS